MNGPKGQDKADNIARKALIVCDALATRLESAEQAIQQLRETLEAFNVRHTEALKQAIDLPRPIVSAIESPRRGPGRPRKGDEQAATGRVAPSGDRAA